MSDQKSNEKQQYLLKKFSPSAIAVTSAVLMAFSLVLGGFGRRITPVTILALLGVVSSTWMLNIYLTTTSLSRISVMIICAVVAVVASIFCAPDNAFIVFVGTILIVLASNIDYILVLLADL